MKTTDRSLRELASAVAACAVAGLVWFGGAGIAAAQEDDGEDGKEQDLHTEYDDMSIDHAKAECEGVHEGTAEFDFEGGGLHMDCEGADGISMECWEDDLQVEGESLHMKCKFTFVRPAPSWEHVPVQAHSISPMGVVRNPLGS